MRLTTYSRIIGCPKGIASRMTNSRRIQKRQLGLHGKRKTKYRKAELIGGR